MESVLNKYWAANNKPPELETFRNSVRDIFHLYPDMNPLELEVLIIHEIVSVAAEIRLRHGVELKKKEREEFMGK